MKPKPQPLQGNSHRSGGDLPHTPPTQLPNIHSGMGSTENAKNKIANRPDQVAGSQERLAYSHHLAVGGVETNPALKPAIGSVKKGGITRPLVPGVKLPCCLLTTFGTRGLRSKTLRHLATRMCWSSPFGSLNLVLQPFEEGFEGRRPLETQTSLDYSLDLP